MPIGPIERRKTMSSFQELFFGILQDIKNHTGDSLPKAMLDTCIRVGNKAPAQSTAETALPAQAVEAPKADVAQIAAPVASAPEGQVQEGSAPAAIEEVQALPSGNSETKPA
jgi:hypothetical protein